VDSTATVTATNTLTVAAPTQVWVQSPGPSTGNSVNSLPDADSQGFMTYQGGGARCHGSDRAALIVRTPESAAVWLVPPPAGPAGDPEPVIPSGAPHPPQYC